VPSRRLPRDFEPNELTRLAAERRRAGVDLIDLTETNPTRVGLETADGPMAAALSEAARGPYEPDPRGLLTAREAIAEYLGTRLDSPGARETVSPDRLVLTSGTSEAYAHLMRLLCDPGDEIAAPRPSYPLFAPLAQLEGIELATYRLAYDGRWRLDRDSLEAAVGPRTRAVIVVMPNNPTGSCLTSHEVEFVEAFCAERGLAIISDEVFGDFPWEAGRERPLASLLGRRSALTFVLNGISKLCGLPQLKLAWIAVSGPAAEARSALEGLEWISDLFLSVATPVQRALPALLRSRSAFQARVSERVGRNLAAAAVTAASAGRAEVLAGDGGWSAILRARAATFSEIEALEQGVLVHPGHFYELDDACAVVSLLVEPARFQAGVGRLLAVV
jgi:alanine-synthesizing transaminase